MVTMPEGPGGKASGGAAERSDTISPDGRDFIRTGFGAAAARAHVEWGKFNADGKLVGLKWAHAKYAMPKNDDAVFVSKATYRNGLGRSDANIDRVYLITLDDIGSKIDLTETTALYRAAGLPPTWTTETSKCNYQLAWAVEGGMSPAQYRAVKTAIKRQSVWGKTDTTAASQLVRLPMGVNGKPGPKAEWRVRAEALGRCYALEELQPLFGQFDAVPDGIPDMKLTPGAATNTSLESLRAPSLRHVIFALRVLRNDGTSWWCAEYDGWFAVCMAIKGALGEEGRAVWLRWCEAQPQQKADPDEKWDSVEPHTHGWPSLEYWMSLADPQRAAWLAFRDGWVPDETAMVAAAAVVSPAELLQEAMATRIFHDHGHRIRFNLDRGHWHEFDGKVWLPRGHQMAFELARKLVAQTRVCANKSDREKISKAAFCGGVETFCRNDSRLLAHMSDFDKDPWLLGAPNGIVDLRTGQFRPARPEDMVSRQVLIDPADKADCPKFMVFLDEVTQGDKKIKQFLQEWFGYGLTGKTSEQIFLFIYGPGDNGKGVLVDTIAAIMKDYAVTPEAEVFTQRKYSGHPQEIASLAGARMCSVSEVDAGAQWNIRLLKDVTGGGKISAHFMRQNQFAFFPEFKLTISGNHQPTFPGGITPAVRRQFHMLNFLFRPKHKNKNLKDELLADEGPGILRWMIDGCLSWQRRGKKGLVIPKKVRSATDAFLHDEDLLARWIEAETRKVPGASTPSQEAFRRWCEWRNAQGNSNLFDTNRSFSLEMQNNGWVATHTKTANVFAGLELLKREDSFLNPFSGKGEGW